MASCSPWDNHSWEYGESVAEEERKKLPLCCDKAYQSYKGQRKPTCCGGKGCQVCWMIYKAKYKSKKKDPGPL